MDASVVVKWLVAEDGRDEARELLGHRIERHAPDLLLTECADAIWRKSRLGEIGAARPFIEQVSRLPEVVTLHPSPELLRDAAAMARRTGRGVSDCLYLACARRTGSVLVTADRRLAEIVSRRVPALTAITLDERKAMAAVEAEGVRFVIGREEGGELIEAWGRFAAPGGSAPDDVVVAPELALHRESRRPMTPAIRGTPPVSP